MAQGQEEGQKCDVIEAVREFTKKGLLCGIEMTQRDQSQEVENLKPNEYAALLHL